MTGTLTLPEGYEVMSDADYAFYRGALMRFDTAWSVYEVTSGDGSCTVHWRTNDDRDHGIPSEFAQDTWTSITLVTALRHCGGGTRQGVGQTVVVLVDGKPVKKVG